MARRQPARTAVRLFGSAILAASVVVGAALIGLAVSPLDMAHGNPEAAVTGIDSDQPTAVIRIDSDQTSTEDRDQPDDHNRRDRQDRRSYLARQMVSSLMA